MLQKKLACPTKRSEQQWCCRAAHPVQSLCLPLPPFPHHPLAFRGDDVQHVPKACPTRACCVARTTDSLPEVQHPECLQAWSPLMAEHSQAAAAAS